MDYAHLKALVYCIIVTLLFWRCLCIFWCLVHRQRDWQSMINIWAGEGEKAAYSLKKMTLPGSKHQTVQLNKADYIKGYISKVQHVYGNTLLKKVRKEIAINILIKSFIPNIKIDYSTFNLNKVVSILLSCSYNWIQPPRRGKGSPRLDTIWLSPSISPSSDAVPFPRLTRMNHGAVFYSSGIFMSCD